MTHHSPTSTQLLAVDQADNRVRLVEPDPEHGLLKTIWSYPDTGEATHEHRPPDAKFVIFNDEVHVLAAYHGRVRLIRYPDRTVRVDLPAPRSCHSAEMLPDGRIASTSSNDDLLILHDRSGASEEATLPFAPQRMCLKARSTTAETRSATSSKLPWPSIRSTPWSFLYFSITGTVLVSCSCNRFTIFGSSLS